MAPRHSANDNSDSAAWSFTFPQSEQPSSSTRPFLSNSVSTTTNAGNTTTFHASLNGTTTTAAQAVTSTVVTVSRTHYKCSSIPRSAASYLFRQRLLSPAIFIPLFLLFGPALVISGLAFLAYLSNCESRLNDSLTSVVVPSVVIIFLTCVLVQSTRKQISKHAPNEKKRKEALAKCYWTLPFWSLVVSIFVVYSLRSIMSSFLPFLSNSCNADQFKRQGSYRGSTNWSLGLITSTFSWGAKTAKIMWAPALGWAFINALVTLRYVGFPLPIVRCSCTPLRINPLHAKLRTILRPFTSVRNFRDFIAAVTDKLNSKWIARKTRNAGQKQMMPNAYQRISSSNAPFPIPQSYAKPKNELERPNQTNVSHATSPSASQYYIQFMNGNIWLYLKSMCTLSATARYTKPGPLHILANIPIHIACGYFVAHAVALPPLAIFCNGKSGSGEGYFTMVVVLSCAIFPVFELLSNSFGVHSIQSIEIDFRHYSSAGVPSKIINLMAVDTIHVVQKSFFGSTSVFSSVIIAVVMSNWLESPSLSDTLQSTLVSYITVALFASAMAIQEVLTRWTVCAPGLDADTLLSQAPKIKNTSSKFVTEDLFIESILMGDGATVDKVIAPTSGRFSRNHQEEEIARNEKSMASFSEWILLFSTNSSSKLSADILRMCLLESIGGGGCSSSLKAGSFGEKRHSFAIRRRLDLSSANACPGRQPLAVPLVRSLCAFAGGIGEALLNCCGRGNVVGDARGRNTANEWKLPIGAFAAAEHAIIAAARFVVMNLISDRQGHVVVDIMRRHDRLSLLLPCVLQSAHILRSGLLAYGKDNSSLEIQSVISACDSSAKMVLRILPEIGGFVLEEFLRRNWKDMTKWLRELIFQMSETAVDER